MTLNWTDVALVVAIVVAGTGTMYFLLARRLERMLSTSRHDTERRLAALIESMSIQGPSSEEAVSSTDAPEAVDIDAGASSGEKETTRPRPDELRESQAQNMSHDGGVIAPEIQAAIAAAAIATLGNHARVRSARQVPSSDVVSPWTQQGRVIVQSSHNLRNRR